MKTIAVSMACVGLMALGSSLSGCSSEDDENQAPVVVAAPDIAQDSDCASARLTDDSELANEESEKESEKNLDACLNLTGTPTPTPTSLPGPGTTGTPTPGPTSLPGGGTTGLLGTGTTGG